MNSGAILATLVGVWLVSIPVSASAQSTSKGDISGSVTDTSQLPVPAATIVASQIGTPYVRTTVSDLSGRFGFHLLEPAVYELRASAPGLIGAPVTLVVPPHSVVRVSLTVGVTAISQTVDVMAPQRPAPVGGSISSWVGHDELNALPLNDKLISEFTRLDAGSTPRGLVLPESSGVNTDSGGWMAGARQFFTSITLDGGHFNDPTFPGGNITNTQGVSVGALADLSLVRGTPAAPDANAIGTGISLTTRSGSSRYSGEAAIFYRNDAMDARSFFDGPDPPPFERAQYRGTVGGPLPLRRPHRDFFFASYEGNRRAAAQSVTPVVPSGALLSAVPGGPSNGYLRELLMASYPRATEERGAVGTARAEANQDMRRDLAVVRIDSGLGTAGRFLARYNYVDGRAEPGVQVATGVNGADSGFDWHFGNALVGYTHSTSQGLAAEIRLTVDRTRSRFFAQPTPDALSALGFAATADSPSGVPFVAFAGTGLSSIGALPLVPKSKSSTVVELGANSALATGMHTVRFGGTFRSVGADWLLGENTRPAVVFLGFGPPYDQSPFGLTTGRYLSLTQNFALTDSPWRRFSYRHVEAYATDSVQLGSRLLVTAGINASYQTPISETAARLTTYSPGSELTSSTLPTIRLIPTSDEGLTQSPTPRVAPSIAIAWRPQALPSLQPVVSAAYSRAHASPFFELIRLVGFNPPFGTSVVFRGRAFGSPISPLDPGAQPNTALYDAAGNRPRMDTFSAGVDLELSRLSASFRYVGHRGTDLWDVRQPNFGASYPGIRPNSALGVVTVTEARARSRYDALRASAQYRTARVLLRASYVLGQTLDDISAGITSFRPTGIGSLPIEQNDLRGNWGPADFDIRHNLALNTVWTSPASRSALLSNWSVALVASFWSGLPYDVLSGVDNNGDGIVNDRARSLVDGDIADLIPAGEGTAYIAPGGAMAILSPTSGTPLARNVLRGPSFTNVDVSVRKHLAGIRTSRLTASVEIFNLLNRANFSVPVNTLSSPLFGRLTSTINSGRQVQLGLELVF